jgi:hypothetical protein
LDQPVSAVAVCDGRAVALASDGAYGWRGDDLPARLADRPPARRLACGPDAATRFVATGVGVWTSPDGAAWSEREETLGRSIASAAATDRLWVAIGGDLVALDQIEAPIDPPPTATRGAPLLPALAAPALPWPRVTIAFGAELRAIDQERRALR